MTLPPHRIGDKGQRYKFSCLQEGEILNVGYANDPKAFLPMMRLMPGVTEMYVEDRVVGTRKIIKCKKISN